MRQDKLTNVRESSDHGEIGKSGSKDEGEKSESKGMEYGREALRKGTKKKPKDSRGMEEEDT